MKPAMYLGPRILTRNFECVLTRLLDDLPPEIAAIHIAHSSDCSIFVAGNNTCSCSLDVSFRLGRESPIVTITEGVA